MKEVITKRNFNVPVELLYQAWVNPEQLKNWWGPNGFTNTFREFDFKPGGKWSFIMHGPDGKEYENESKFETIKENELVILRHISKPEYKATFIFSANGSNSSSLKWTMVFEEEKAYHALKNIVAEKNEENLDRLVTELEKKR